MAKVNMDHLCDSSYVNVPHIYTEQLKAIRPELFNASNHDLYDCHTGLQLDSLYYSFSEFGFDNSKVEEVINFLHEYNIPFLIRQNFTESLYIEYLYLINPHSSSNILAIEATEFMLDPIKGRLLELAEHARERARNALPAAGFINNVMKQQMVLFKLTGTIDTLTEFKYEPIRRKTE